MTAVEVQALSGVRLQVTVWQTVFPDASHAAVWQARTPEFPGRLGEWLFVRLVRPWALPESPVGLGEDRS